jgi:UDP-3-O-[3-hydroxymyristoyl] N-acetylglucosamine deacetylase
MRDLAIVRQTTLAKRTRLEGVGVHSGAPVTLVLGPAPANAGIVFVRVDLEGAGRAIPAKAERVCDTRLATVIASDEGVTVSTVEHVVAALAGLGVDNALVEIDGPETPIMDGGAGDFADAIASAGVIELEAPRRFIQILEPVEASGPRKRAALVPAGGFELDVEIVFDAPAIGRQRLAMTLTPAAFCSELARARTFGFLSEVEQLRAAGLGRGASLENTVVVDGARVVNPEALARPDDFVRHKMLDAVGDLALVGHPIIGRYEASCSGHALNNELVRTLLSRPSAWRLTEQQPASA